MLRRLWLMMLLLLTLVGSASSGPCDDVPWDRLKEALVRGDEGDIATLIGSGRLSLRLDDISQGRYTAQQARQLLEAFFSRTDNRFLSYDPCNSSGNRAWSQATYSYRRRSTTKVSEERLLLEWCVEGQDVRLSGIRSVSMSSHDLIPSGDGTT